MEFTYDSAMKFMQEYFYTVSNKAQDVASVGVMENFFAPDLEITPHVHGQAKVTGREGFMKLLSLHPSFQETLKPQEILIDVNKKWVTVLLITDVSEKATGKVLLSRLLVCIYQLGLDEAQNIKIKKMQYFEEGVPPGTIQIQEIYGREAGMSTMFTGEA